MEPEPTKQEAAQTKQAHHTSRLHQVTLLSKYLAMALFIILPFVGGWIGYQFAPEKVVEVEKGRVQEASQETVQNDDKAAQNDDTDSNGTSQPVRSEDAETVVDSEDSCTPYEVPLCHGGFMSESQPCTDTMCQEAIDTTADHLTLQENAGNTVVLSFACGPTVPTRERIDRVSWGDGTDEYYDVLQRCTDGRVDISHTYDDAAVRVISGIYGASANDGRDVLVDQIKYIPSDLE